MTPQPPKCNCTDTELTKYSISIGTSHEFLELVDCRDVCPRKELNTLENCNALFIFSSRFNHASVKYSQFAPSYIRNYSSYRAFASPHLTYAQVNKSQLIKLAHPNRRIVSLVDRFEIMPNSDFGDSHCICSLCKRYQREVDMLTVLKSELWHVTDDVTCQCKLPHIAESRNRYKPSPTDTPLTCIKSYIKFHFSNWGPSAPRLILDAFCTLFTTFEVSGLSFRDMYSRINQAAMFATALVEKRNSFTFHTESLKYVNTCTQYDIPTTPMTQFTRHGHLKNLKETINAWFYTTQLTPYASLEQYISLVDLLTSSPEADYYTPNIWRAHQIFGQLDSARSYAPGILELDISRMDSPDWDAPHMLVRPYPNRETFDHSWPENKLNTCFAPPVMQVDERRMKEINTFLTALKELNLSDAPESQGFEDFIRNSWTTIAGTAATSVMSFMDCMASLTSLVADAVKAIATYLTNNMVGSLFRTAYKAFKSFIKGILGPLAHLASRVVVEVINYLKNPMHIAHIFQAIGTMQSTTWTQLIVNATGLIISVCATDLIEPIKNLVNGAKAHHALAGFANEAYEHWNSQGPEAEMDGMRLAETAFALASVLILGKTYNNDNEKTQAANSFRDWLKEYGNAGRAFSNVMMAGRHFKEIFGFFRDLFFHAAYWILGSSGMNNAYARLLSDLPEKITTWATEVINATDPALRHKVTLDETFRAHVNDLYLRSKQIHLDILTIPHQMIATHLVGRLIHSITELYDLAITSGKSSVRIDPYCTVFYGDPGYGKSYVMTKLSHHICQRRNWPSESIYSLPAGFKHYDAYEPSIHKIQMIDDMSQFCQPDADSGPMLIQIKTNAPYNTPQASEKSKGKKWYNSEYIVGSTNTLFPTHQATLRTSPAFYRRRNLMVKVTLCPKWLEESGFGAARKNSEAPEISDYLTEQNRIYLSHLRFQLVHPCPPPETGPAGDGCSGVEKLLGSQMDFMQFLEVFDQKSGRYMENQRRILSEARQSSIALDAAAKEYYEDLREKNQPCGPGCDRDICEEPSCVALRELYAAGPSSQGPDSLLKKMKAKYNYEAGIRNITADPINLPTEPTPRPCFSDDDVPIDPFYAESFHVKPRYTDGFLTHVEFLDMDYPLEFLETIELVRADQLDEQPNFLYRAFNYVTGGVGHYWSNEKQTTFRAGFVFRMKPSAERHGRFLVFKSYWDGLISLNNHVDIFKVMMALVRANDERRTLVYGVRADLPKVTSWIKYHLKAGWAKALDAVKDKRFYIALAVLGGAGALGYVAHHYATKPDAVYRIDAHHFFQSQCNYDGKPCLVCSDNKYAGSVIHNLETEGGYSVDQKRLAKILTVPEAGAGSYSGDQKRLPSQRVLPEGTTYGTNQKHLPRVKIGSEGGSSYNPSQKHLPRPGAIHVVNAQGPEEFDYATMTPMQLIPPPPGITAEGTNDANALQSLHGLYSRNMVNLYFNYCVDEEIKHFQVGAIGIVGTTVLAPSHFFMEHRLKKDDHIRVTGFDCHVITIPFDPRNLVTVSEDIVLYQLGPRYPSFRSGILEHHLIREDDLGYLPTRCPMILAGIRVSEHDTMPTREVHLGVGGAIDKRKRLEYKASVTDPKGEIVFVREGYTYDMMTHGGDCGKILIALSTHLPRKILGMHTFGWGKLNKGGALTTTYEQVSRALGQLTDQLLKINPHHLDVAFSEDHGVPSAPEIPMLPDGTMPQPHGYEIHDEELVAKMQVIPQGNYTVLGVVDKKWAISQSSRTELRKSLIHGSVHEPTHAPAALCRAQAPECPTTPLVEAVSKYGKIVLPFPSSDVEAAYAHTRDLLKDVCITTYRPPQVATLDEAINGIRSPSGVIIENFRPMEMTSSAGYPHRLPLRRPNNRPGKKAYFTPRDDEELAYDITDETLLQEIQEKETYAAKGLRIPSVTMDVLKDELRTLQKVKLGKTRAINVMPLPFVILFRMYFLDFKNAFCNAHGKFFGCVGTDASGPDWTQLWNKLRKMSPDGFAGDYANWDGTIESYLMMLVADMVTEWYGDKHGNVRRVLMHEIIHTLHLAQNTLYMKHQGNPSGCPLTVELNSICNFLYALLVWRISAREHGRLDMLPLRKFDQHVVNFNYGDDNIFAVAPEAQDFFNQITFTKVMKDHGITYTRADKTETSFGVEPLTNLTFLKRGFVPHPTKPKFMLAPIEKATIFRMLDWVRKSRDEEELLTSNVNDALEFAYHWNVEFYRDFQAKVNTALFNVGVRTNSTTWNDLDEIFLAKFAN